MTGSVVGRWGGAMAAVLVLVALGAAPAEAAAPASSDRSAAVQAMLDRVLGPGGAFVQVAQQVNTSSGVRTSVRYGAAVASATQFGALQQSGGSSAWGTRQDAVDRSTTTVATPAGALVRQTVTVLVDRARLHGSSVRALRRLVASAAGVQAARGDRLLLVVTRLVKPPAAPLPASRPIDPAAVAVPAMWTAGGLGCVVIALLGLRRRRPAR